jgi:hypothetical protein
MVAQARSCNAEHVKQFASYLFFLLAENTPFLMRRGRKEHYMKNYRTNLTADELRCLRALTEFKREEIARKVREIERISDLEDRDLNKEEFEIVKAYSFINTLANKLFKKSFEKRI